MEGTNFSGNDIELKSEDEKIRNKDIIDHSVRQMKSNVAKMSRHENNLVIRELSKKYATSNGKDDYVALKPFSLAI